MNMTTKRFYQLCILSGLGSGATLVGQAVEETSVPRVFRHVSVHLADDGVKFVTHHEIFDTETGVFRDIKRETHDRRTNTKIVEVFDPKTQCFVVAAPVSMGLVADTGGSK